MENKDWGEIEVYNTLNIIGRGLVLSQVQKPMLEIVLNIKV